MAQFQGATIFWQILLMLRSQFYSYQDFNNPTSNSWKMFQDVFLFPYLLFTYKSFTVLCETWTIKRQQMAKMSNRVPKGRLGTSKLNHVFLKIYTYDPTSKFQE